MVSLPWTTLVLTAFGDRLVLPEALSDLGGTEDEHELRKGLWTQYPATSEGRQGDTSFTVPQTVVYFDAWAAQSSWSQFFIETITYRKVWRPEIRAFLHLGQG